MSDTIIGVIIGSGLAFVGTIVSILLTGRVTRMQLDHDSWWKSQQNIIEARKGYLQPLRQELSVWAKTSQDWPAALARLLTLKSKNMDAAERQVESNEIEQMMRASKDSTDRLATIRGMIADNALNQLLDEFSAEQEKVNIELLPLIRTLNSPNTLNMSTDKIAEIDEAIEQARKKPRAKLIQINRRIEELWAGTELK